MVLSVLTALLIPPISLPVCEQFCEIYSREPVFVTYSGKSVDDLEFCIAEGISRFRVAPNVYHYGSETVMVAYGGQLTRRIVVRIIPNGSGNSIAAYTERKDIDERLARYVRTCAG